MIVQKKDIVHALEKVKPGLASKEMIEQSTSFAFMGERIVTYNDEISLSHPIPNMKITGAIKADEFYKLLSKIKNEEIEMEVSKSTISIKAGKFKSEFTMQQEIKLPIEEIGEIKKFKKLPDNFIDAIKFTMFSCSSDMSKPILTCIAVHKEGFTESNDDHRGTKYNMNEEVPFSFLIPASSAKELVKFKVKSVAKGEGWIHFKTEEDTIFSCRVLNDAYPDSSKIYKVKDKKKIDFPKSINEMLDRASVFSKREFYLLEEVQVSLKDNYLKIRSEAMDGTGWSEEKAKVKYTDEPIEFSINPNFLFDIIKSVRSCSLGKDRISFKGVQWEHILLLKA